MFSTIARSRLFRKQRDVYHRRGGVGGGGRERERVETIKEKIIRVSSRYYRFRDPLPG